VDLRCSLISESWHGPTLERGRDKTVLTNLVTAVHDSCLVTHEK
jgi:hypothetical protein